MDKSVVYCSPGLPESTLGSGRARGVSGIAAKTWAASALGAAGTAVPDNSCRCSVAAERSSADRRGGGRGIHDVGAAPPLVKTTAPAKQCRVSIPIRTISNFFKNLRRYSRMNVYDTWSPRGAFPWAPSWVRGGCVRTAAGRVLRSWR